MKTVKPINLLLSGAILFSAAAYAGPGHHDRGGRYEPVRHVQMPHERSRNGSWVVPLVVGGVLGYILSEPRRESVTYVSNVQTPVVYAPEPVYEERWVYFSECDCQRRVLVQVR